MKKLVWEFTRPDDSAEQGSRTVNVGVLERQLIHEVVMVRLPTKPRLCYLPLRRHACGG